MHQGSRSGKHIKQWFAVAMTVACTSTLAGELSNKPVRIVVPYAAGSTTDIIARLIAQPLQAELKRTVVVENRPGAGGLLGTDHVLKSEPDGHTLVLGTTSNMITTPLVNPTSKYTFRDFAGIGKISSYYFALATANNATAPKSLQELSAELKKGGGSFATTGAGTIVQMTGMRFMQAAGVNATNVHYPGSGQVLTDVAAGHVLFSSETIAASLPLIQGGKLRALAVTSPQRSPSLGAVPTVQESGFAGFVSQSWAGLWVPAKTPKKVVDHLHAALMKVVSRPEMRSKISELAMEPADLTSASEFDKFVANEAAGWAEVVAKSTLQMN